MRFRLYSPLTTTDDRGQRPVMTVLGTRGLALRDPRVQEVNRQLTSRVWAGTAGACVMLGAATAVGSLVIGSLFPVSGNSLTSGMSIGIMMFPIVWVIGLLSQRRIERVLPAVARVLVRDGLCGACGYNLHGLAPAPDRCIECPECGAAWKQDTVERTAPVDDRPPTVGQQVRLAAAEFRSGNDAHIDRRYGVDDLGLPTPLLTTDELRSLPRMSPGLASRALAAAHRIQAESGARRRNVAFACGLFICAAVPAAMVGPGPLKAPLLLLAGGAALGGYLAVRTNFILRPSTIIAAAKAAGLCPACAFDIAMTEIDRDGVTRCPKCDASWRLGLPLSRSAPLA
jgi:predicted Zn-ribbon and HTH transcriptional regulator